ncbi:MAG TPA: PqiC family protein [Candidatus Limnocylindria bacterium]|jgi:uncharacterized lipoprotein YmbA|nr:PqiC family protein [Candidatus Limnocylindria bacterium]
MLAVVLLSGCGALRPQEDPTRFYILTATATPIAPRPAGEGEPGRLQVLLKPIELPRYLQSRSMVVRTGTNEVRFAEFERWAEPLDLAIGRVLKENLGHAPNVAGVAVNARGDSTPDCEVVVRILACEGVRMASGGGSVRFEATWEVRHLGADPAPAKRGEFKAEAMAWDGLDYGQLAGRLSEAVAAAANAIAADLR